MDAQLDVIISFICKTHKGIVVFNWLFLVTCCDLCWLPTYLKGKNHGQGSYKGN